MAGRAVGRDGKAARGEQAGREEVSLSLLSFCLSSHRLGRWREFGTRTKGKPQAGEGSKREIFKLIICVTKVPEKKIKNSFYKLI